MNIELLTLETADLDSLKLFYSQLLGLPVVTETNDHITLKIGSSKLAFATTTLPQKPFYHVAFNIPAQQFNAAKDWLKERLTLATEAGADEIQFSAWSSTSCYFEDPAGNIIEFIARKSHSALNAESFSPLDCLNISEIGVTVPDIVALGTQLRASGFPLANQGAIDPEGLAFFGSEPQGAYLILVQPGRRWLFSTKRAQIFPLTIRLREHRLQIAKNGQAALTAL